MGKEVTVALPGAGNPFEHLSRIVKHPEFMRLTAVAEPNDLRRDRMTGKFEVPGRRCFKNREEFLVLPKMADAVIVGTADHLH